jgi:YebC/PmpR family DNA-binding regulatory protein
MSGHSKWAGIKHKKAAVDAKRGKLFSTLTREIIVAARVGGGNPEGNARLKNAIQKAKEYNMPQENIRRAIQRGTGELPGGVLEEIVYEGYGAGGVAIYVEAMTDNRNRTTARIRSIFSRKGGTLGNAGCVAWMFNKRGYILVEREGISEDELLEIAVESGAEDVKTEEEGYEIITTPENFESVKDALLKRNLKLKYAEITMIPQNYVKIDDKSSQQVLSLMESLEEDEDVQHVYTNFEIPDKLLTALQKE